MSHEAVIVGVKADDRLGGHLLSDFRESQLDLVGPGLECSQDTCLC